MIVELNAVECRVIGALLEKEITTPEQYPLSLNGLTNACNQKSNREPVMDLTETDVQLALDELSKKRQVSEDTWGSRVSKYKHKFCNTEFGSLKFSPQQTAVICLLFLRGPQTPGELRSRSGRLAEFDDVAQVENTLQSLMDFNQEQLVRKLPREPGKRESRYQHCFSGETEIVVDVKPAEEELDLKARVETLEEQVQHLIQQLANMQGK